MVKPITYCTIDGCTGRCHGNGLCQKHYQRQYKHGSTDVIHVGHRFEKTLAQCSTHPDTPAVIREMCRSCYARWLRNRTGVNPCSIEGCPRDVYSNSMCGTHYARLRRTGTVELARKRWEERFWAKVDRSPGLGPNGDCWEWIGARNGYDYGVFVRGTGDRWMSHRLSYTMHVGPIPDGHHVDHVCVNPPCLNPAHLEAVPPRENTKRAWARINEREFTH